MVLHTATEYQRRESTDNRGDLLLRIRDDRVVAASSNGQAAGAAADAEEEFGGALAR